MTSLELDGSSMNSIYTGRTTNGTMVASTCVAAVLLVLMGKQPSGPWSSITVPFLLVGVGVVLNMLTASSVRATAGPNGFTVHGALWAGHGARTA